MFSPIRFSGLNAIQGLFNRPIDHVDFPIASREAGFTCAGIGSKPVNFLKFLLIEHLPDGRFVFLQSVDIRCHVSIQVRRSGFLRCAGDGAAMGAGTEAAECCAEEFALPGFREVAAVAGEGCTSLFCDLSLRAISPKDWPSCAKEVDIEKAKSAIQSKYLRTMATA